MHRQKQVAQSLGRVLGDEVAREKNIAQRFGHLLFVDRNQVVVHRNAREKLFCRRFRLRDFVFVVGMDEVEPSPVDVERFAQKMRGHRRALDVPSRPALAPRAVPRRLVGRLLRLPKTEIERVAFFFVGLDAHAHEQVVDFLSL